MDIFIRWGKNDASGFKLPVNPSSYKIDGKQQNTSVNIHASGEINLKGKRALRTVSWSCFFPNRKYDFAQAKYHNPIDYYVKKLVTLMDNNTTVHLVLGESINFFGTIESFSWGENEGNGDINYEISIKEQRTLGGTSRNMSIFSDDYVVYVWKKNDTWTKAYKKIWGRMADKTNPTYTITYPIPITVGGRRVITRRMITTTKLQLDGYYNHSPEYSRKYNKKVINAAIKEYRKANPRVKKVKEEVALVGKEVILWA